MITIFIVFRPEGNKQRSWKTDGQIAKIDISHNRKLLVNTYRVFSFDSIKRNKNQSG